MDTEYYLSWTFSYTAYFILARNPFYLTSFCTVCDFHLIYFLSNPSQLGLHAEDSFHDKFLRDVMENITDLLLQMVHCGGWHGLVHLVIYHPHKKSPQGLDTLLFKQDQTKILISSHDPERLIVRHLKVYEVYIK